MKLFNLAPAASLQILVVVASLTRSVQSEVQVTDSTEKELLAEIKSVPVSSNLINYFYFKTHL